MVCASGTDFTTIVKACVYSRESYKVSHEFNLDKLNISRVSKSV